MQNVKKIPSILDKSDGIPQSEIDEITDRIEILEANPVAPAIPVSQKELSLLLASFEAQLNQLNKTLSKETRANRVTIRGFNVECEKAKESTDALNTEIEIVVGR
jgi:hypothetical protein